MSYCRMNKKMSIFAILICFAIAISNINIYAQTFDQLEKAEKNGQTFFIIMSVFVVGLVAVTIYSIIKQPSEKENENTKSDETIKNVYNSNEVNRNTPLLSQ